MDAVKRMELEPDDVVVRSHKFLLDLEEKEGFVPGWLQTEHVVSSIGSDGQVFFKGEGQAPARYLSKPDAGD